MTKRRPLTDIAYDILSKRRKPLAFKEMWEGIIEMAPLTEEESVSLVGRFYSDMSLDTRFTQLSENRWDLKKRYKFADTFVEVSDDQDDDEDEDEERFDEEEDQEIARDEEEDEY